MLLCSLVAARQFGKSLFCILMGKGKNPAAWDVFSQPPPHQEKLSPRESLFKERRECMSFLQRQLSPWVLRCQSRLIISECKMGQGRESMLLFKFPLCISFNMSNEKSVRTISSAAVFGLQGLLYLFVIYSEF